MVTAEGVADTVTLLLPGFIALKVFYQFGLKTRRTDLQWTLWSVLVAFLLAPVTVWLHDDWSVRVQPIWLGLVVGLVAGVVLVVGWRILVRLVPGARVRFALTVWDAVLPRTRWVQVVTADDRVLSGTIDQVTSTAESDEHDIYLTNAAWVDEEGTTKPLSGEGLWIPRAHIRYIQVWPEAPAKKAGTERNGQPAAHGDEGPTDAQGTT